MSESEGIKEERSVSRRTVCCGAAGVAAMFALGGVKLLPETALVRPPGAQDEDRFFAGCNHCMKCMEACPKNAISVSHIEDGVLQVHTPKMDFNQGWCDFCQDVEGGPRCAAVCPTNAITHIDAPQANIGVAKMTLDWCLAYRGMGCRSCVDACPYNAMDVGENNVPYVKEDICNGCGACQNACISLSAGSLSGTWNGEAPTERAITVKPLSE